MNDTLHDFLPAPPPMNVPPEKTIHFMIGRVAGLYGITVQTLRHYDKIGLFRPDVTNEETGYRYYSLKQLRQLEYILFLRDLKLSLSEIQIIMDEFRKGTDFYTVLKRRDEELSRQISEIETIRSTIQTLLKLNNRGDDVRDQIQIKYFDPPRQLIYQDITPLDVSAPDFAYQLMVHRKELVGSGPSIQTTYCFGSAVSLADFNETGHIRYQGILMDPGPYGDTLPEGTRLLPTGYYASILFSRSETQPESAYRKLSRFVEEHHFQTDGTIYEMSVDSSFTSISRLSDLTELQLRIELNT